ncbi:MAG: hypothetical protein H7839_01305 [Magnetococcus sp. YQC-5]
MLQPFAHLSPDQRRALSMSDLIGHAETLRMHGQIGLAAELYQEWLTHNATHPNLHFIYYNQGVVLLESNDLTGAKQAFNEAIRCQPDFFPTYINLGNVLERLGSPQEAAECWRQIVNRTPNVNAETIGYKTSALKQIARVKGMEEAEIALQQSLEINPHQHEVIEHWINWRQVQCKWPVIVPFAQCDKSLLMKGFAPLSMAVYTDDPLLQLSNACMYHKSEIGQPQPTFQHTHSTLLATPSTRPRVGYLSSDLRVHAIGYLMVELFELHDRNRVEVFVYSIGQQFEDPIRQRIRTAVEHWRDLSVMTDVQAAEQIIADRIEILVDVNGYTHSARTKLLAMRPAPVIVNWLGYPGTMGSPYHNYIISDGFIIPKEHEIYYSEHVMRLPCYQPNDRKRYVVEHRPSRQEVGLPENVIVYGCFNSIKKITAFTWNLWMRILREVPDSVLWLLFESDQVKERMLELARQQGLGSDRVLSASRMVNHEHMARYPLVDLMLDSAPYGAHTTASDALWMGVPILTFAGLSFPARVCGSLVRAAGLAELVCDTPEAYVTRAVELGRNRELLRVYRQRLLVQRDSCVLFDTPSLTTHLEGLYHQMWADFRHGTVPRPDLSNLDLYQQIGIELDQEGSWFLTPANLTKAYMEKLLQKDQLYFIRDDHRLWSNEVRHHHAVSKRHFLDTVVRLDDADNLDAFLQFVQEKNRDPQEMMVALEEVLSNHRVRAAYILAMLLANSGYRTPAMALALCLGGLLFGNPMEEARGLEYWPDQLKTLSVAQKNTLSKKILVPILNLLHTDLFVNTDPTGLRRLQWIVQSAIGEDQDP